MAKETVRDLDADSVTEVVLEQMARTPDPRLREIMEAAVRHLHAFAREVSLTPAEWLTGIRFLTEVGHACTPVRQEFILLADVLGLSALVNIMHDRNEAELGTQSSLLGPFFREHSPQRAPGESIVSQHEAPEIVVYGRVMDMDGRGVADATVAVWQTDEHGLYDLQRDGGKQMDMRGTFRTDAEGHYHFRTVRPLGYSIPMDGPVGDLMRMTDISHFRPAHIHFIMSAPGYQKIITHLFKRGTEYLENDVVYGVKQELITDFKKNPPGVAPNGEKVDTPFWTIEYDFVLAPEGVSAGQPKEAVAA